jgi:predicted MPP superfamily phosphohydrolase
MIESRPRSSTHPENVMEHRFGVWVPRDGSLAPFRVLVSWRWLVTGLVASVLMLGWSRRLPRHRRLPTVGGSVVAAALAALGMAIGAARRPSFERLELPICDLAPALDGFTIAHIGDLHLGLPFTRANLRRATAWLAEQQPDVIVYTGDFVNHLRRLPLLIPELRHIRAPHGVYAVFGNHDYWAGVEPLAKALADCGIHILRNRAHVLSVCDATLVVAGIDCVWERRHDVATALRDLSPDATVIMLAHEPDIADEVAAYDVALQLSGHTHAGHITLPGLGPLFLPRHGFRYVRGLQRVGNMWLYVTRGLGGLPLRLGGSPEATLHVLRVARR